MARNTYDSETKAEILSAVLEARAGKRKWPEAHKAAKEAGYKGGLPSLMIMFRKNKNGKAKNTRGPGRPRKLEISGTGMSAEIERIVSEAVQSRINTAIDAAIAELGKLKV